MSAYRVPTDEEFDALVKAETIHADMPGEILLAPGGRVVCILGEPEDRTFCRDASDVIAELNDLLAKNAHLSQSLSILNKTVRYTSRNYAGLEKDRNTERECRLANEAELRRADEELGLLRAVLREADTYLSVPYSTSSLYEAVQRAKAKACGTKESEGE